MKKEDKTNSQSCWIRQKFEKVGKKLDIHKNGVIYLKEIDDLFLQQVEAKLRMPLSQFFNAYSIQSKRQTISLSLLVSNLVKAWTLNKFHLKEIINENKKVSAIKEKDLIQINPSLGMVQLEEQPNNPKGKNRKFQEFTRNTPPVNVKTKSTQLRREKQSSAPEEVAINCIICPDTVKTKVKNLHQYHSNTGSKICSKKRSIVKPDKYLSKYLTKKDNGTLNKKCLHKESSIKVGVHSEEISLINKGRSQNCSVQREYGFAKTQLSCESPALIYASPQEKLKIPSSSGTPRIKKLGKLSQFCRPRTETGNKPRNNELNLLYNRKETTGKNFLVSLPEHHSRELSLFDSGLEAMSGFLNNRKESKESETSLSSEFDEIKDWILNCPRKGSLKTFSGENNKCFFDVQSPCKLTQLLRHGYAYQDREKKLYHEQKNQKIKMEGKTANLPENIKEMPWDRNPNELPLKSHQTELKCFPKIRISDNLPETRDFMSQIFRLTEEDISRPNRDAKMAIRLEKANPKFCKNKRFSNSTLEISKNLGQIFGQYSKDELQQLHKLHLLYASQKEEKIQQHKKILYNEVFTQFI